MTWLYTKPNYFRTRNHLKPLFLSSDHRLTRYRPRPYTECGNFLAEWGSDTNYITVTYITIYSNPNYFQPRNRLKPLFLPLHHHPIRYRPCPLTERGNFPDEWGPDTNSYNHDMLILLYIKPSYFQRRNRLKHYLCTLRPSLDHLMAMPTYKRGIFWLNERWISTGY